MSRLEKYKLLKKSLNYENKLGHHYYYWNNFRIAEPAKSNDIVETAQSIHAKIQS
jgi:hypothetical protein